MAYRIIINAGKRQFTKLVGLAAGLLAALRKKKKHTVLNVDIGDDAVVYTKGDKMLAFAKRWLPVFSQQPTLETLNRLGDEGRVSVYGNVPNVLMRAFQNGVIISIRHPDGTWGNVAGTAPYDEVIIPEFRDQTQPPLYSQREVYLVKASADGTTICLLADTCLDTVTGYVRAQLMSPVTLEYSGGGWQPTVPVTGERPGRDHAVDTTDGQMVAVFDYALGGLNIWSCRGTPTWQHTLVGFMPPVPGDNDVRLAAADGYVLWVGVVVADWTGQTTNSYVWAGIFYTAAGTTSVVYDSGMLVGAIITNLGYYKATSGNIDRNPETYGLAYAIMTSVCAITGHTYDMPTGIETFSGTVTTVVVAAGAGGAVSTLYSDTYDGLLCIYNDHTGAVTLYYPEISFSGADIFEAAVKLIIDGQITVYSRGASGAWTQDVALDVGGSVDRAGSNLIGYRTPPPYTSVIQWNGSERISQDGYCLIVFTTRTCRAHGAFYENRTSHGDISFVAMRLDETGTEQWQALVLIHEDDGRYTEILRFAGLNDTFSPDAGMAMSADRSIVAVMWAPTLTTASLDVYMRSGSAYERIYRSEEPYFYSALIESAAEVSADGSRVLFNVASTMIALRVKLGTLEEGEKRVVEIDRVLTSHWGRNGTSAYPLVYPDIPDEGVFFNAQTGQAFQTITRPLIHVAPRPTMIEPENGAPYVFGDNTVLEYRLAPPASNDTGGSEEV